MLSAKVRVIGVDPEHWANLFRLLDPPAGSDPEPGEAGPLGALLKRGGKRVPATISAPSTPRRRRTTQTAVVVRSPAIVLTRGGEIQRIVRLGGGTISRRKLGSIETADLTAFRHELSLPFVAVVDTDALPKLWAGLQRAMRYDGDYVEQQLAFYQIFARMIDDQELIFDPKEEISFKVPPYSALQRALDLAWPDDHCCLFYVVDRGRIWSAVIARKRHGDIDLIAGHRALGDNLRFRSMADAPALVKAAATTIAPVHAGIFVTLTTWKLLVDGDRSALARAAASRQAVLSPCPTWLLAFVGLGAVSDVAGRSARLAGKLLSKTGLLPNADKVLQAN